MKMRNKLLLLVMTVAIVVVGAASFAAFESHLVNVQAHVEKATYTQPDQLDFGVTLMQQKYDAICDLTTNPDNTTPVGDCLSIHLSASFLVQTTFNDVKYEIYCEVKAGDDPDGGPWTASRQITPYIKLTDGDPADADGAVLQTGGIVADSNGDGTPNAEVPGSCKANGGPEKWVEESTLLKSSDEVDLWNMEFFAPLCDDNYQAGTDPDTFVELIPAAECTKGPGPDSDEYVNLGSDVKFQITGYSTP